MGPLEESCSIELVKFDSEDGQHVFWHSSAHILGQAMERLYGGHLCAGPPVEGGFYYDMFMEDRQVSSNDFKNLETIIKKIIKEKQPFERLVLTKAQLLELFKHNPFKQRIIKEKVQTESTTVYRCGPLIDLCRGPHIRNTSKLKAFQVTKNSSAYWEGKSDAENLQRVYAISFPDTKLFKEWKTLQEEAAKRDHRKVGTDQDLFFFHTLSPGSAFFLPHGAIIYNRLVNMIKKEYWKRGFQEVISPNIYNTKLWDISGHGQHYAENMFQTEIEGQKFALKPMNCPGHCLMFDVRPRSWRELPLRMADFGVLHRNEISGALSGLTRVRRFQQDDAHIFLTPEMLEVEIKKCIDFLDFVINKTLGMEYKLYLSTRPEGYLGTIEMWENAESQLSKAMKSYGVKFDIDEGGGAFYGPKIDIKVTDALNRSHQTATVQLDFNLPERFKLSYVDSNNEEKRPIIIHRAILGSLERQMAIITENFGGKWPLWLSPRMVKVITISQKYSEYGQKIADLLYSKGLEAELDTSGNQLKKQIRNAQLEQFNSILVCGEKEQENYTVNVRTRDNIEHGQINVDILIERLLDLKRRRVLNAESLYGEMCKSNATVKE